MEHLVEGWTGNCDFTLLADGAAIDGAGLSVTLVLRDRNGGVVPVSGKVDWLVAASGTVRYSPAAEDLKAARAPYQARFKVNDGTRDVYFPNREADVWQVRL